MPNAHVCMSGPPDAILIATYNDELNQAFYNPDSDGVLAVGAVLIQSAYHTYFVLALAHRTRA